jgi:hypothetical protein
MTKLASSQGCTGGLCWAIGLVNLLPVFYHKPVLVFVDELGLLKATAFWIFLFNPICQMVSFDGGIKSINSMW